jgi:hypothetical protein
MRWAVNTRKAQEVRIAPSKARILRSCPSCQFAAGFVSEFQK